MAINGCLDYAGVAAFATSSALVARHERFDLTATLIFAMIAALGGGTLRDTLIRQPVYWIVDPMYVFASSGAAASVWFLGGGKGLGRIATLMESVGIGCFAVAGAAKGLASGVGIVASIIMGAVTATFGGIMADALAGRRTVISGREVYVTAALVSAATFALLLAAGAGRLLAISMGATIGIALRIAALGLGWRMPVPPPRS